MSTTGRKYHDASIAAPARTGAALVSSPAVKWAAGDLPVLREEIQLITKFLGAELLEVFVDDEPKGQ